MAGKQLSTEQTQAVLDALRSGQFKSVRAVIQATGRHRRTIERIAKAHGLPLPSPVVQVDEHTQLTAAYLLEHSRVTLDALARSLNLSRATLKRRLNGRGLRGAGRHLRASELERIGRMLDAGERPESIARAVDRNVRTVQRYRAERRRGLAAAATARRGTACA